MAADVQAEKHKSELRSKLSKSRSTVIDAAARVRDAEERLDRLPVLEERLRRYQNAGVEARLQERSQLVTEQRVLATAEDFVEKRRSIVPTLNKLLPVDRKFLVSADVKNAKARRILSELDPPLVKLEAELTRARAIVEQALATATSDISRVRDKWDQRRVTVEEAYAKVLRELQATRIDAKDFELRTQIEDLVPTRDQLLGLLQDLETARSERVALLADWEDAKTAEFRQLDRAAARVNKQLQQRARVRVNYAGH